MFNSREWAIKEQMWKAQEEKRKAEREKEEAEELKKKKKGLKAFQKYVKGESLTRDDKNFIMDLIHSFEWDHVPSDMNGMDEFDTDYDD